MYNLLIALAVAALFGFWVGFYGGWIGGVVLGLIAGVIAYFFLARRTANKLAGSMGEFEKHARAGRVDKAIAELERLRPMGRWQFMVGRSIDSQIGALLYVNKQDTSEARPYLEKAPKGAWHARAMLAADHYRQKQYDEMRAIFDKTIKSNRKASLLYATYAWCEWKLGQRDRAIEILGDGLKKLPSDDRLKRNQTALQNHKKMQLKAYGLEWYALKLEAPPAQQTAHAAKMHPGQARAMRQARRGRR